MRHYLLQIDDKQHYSEDVAVVAKNINEQNWLHSHYGIQYKITDCSLENINCNICKDIIPVGSIEFVNKSLEIAYKCKPMVPINIPNELTSVPMPTYYTGRNTCIVKSKEEIKKLYNKWHTKLLFIKSASRLKADYTDIYSVNDTLPDDTLYFVSEVIDNIKSEWRCFVHNGKLIDIKNYSGDFWILPDKKMVASCIEKIGKTLPAYTLDVAVLNYRTVIIEIHNFISCGLYGFDNKEILSMLYDGIKTQLKSEK